MREATGLAAMPLHRARGTDPNWRFEQIVDEERKRGATGSTFFVLAAHHDPHDGAAPETYDALRPKLVETILETGAEIGLHGSYTAADDRERLAQEKAKLEALAGTVEGHRFHYLRGDPHRNIASLPFRYDTTLGFPDAVGFRAGIARPFHPWDFDREQPAEVLEVPLAAMDATLAEERYLGRNSCGCSTGRPSTAARSPSSGTRTVSTRSPRAAGTGSTRACSTRSPSAAASAFQRPSSSRPTRPDRSSAAPAASGAPARRAAPALRA